MTLRKKISAFLVLSMLAMQLLLAQHYTVHFNEDDHLVPAKHGKADPDKICQVCIFSKNFSHTAAADSVYFAVLLLAAAIFVSASFAAPAQYPAHAYAARGPPSFLS